MLNLTLKIAWIFLALLLSAFSSKAQSQLELTVVVKDVKTSEILEATMEIFDGKDTLRIHSDSSGYSKIKIYPGIKYELIARSDGYLAEWLEFTSSSEKDTSLAIFLPRKKWGVWQGENLKGVLFEKGSALLKDTLSLSKWAISLRKAELVVVITGLSIKKESNYLRLARKRAEAVKEYLKSKGIPEDRITIYTGVLVLAELETEGKKEIIGVDLEVFPK